MDHEELTELHLADLVKVIQVGAKCNKFTRMREENFYNLAEALDIDLDGVDKLNLRGSLPK